MPKILPATCENQVVTSEEVTVPDTVIFSEGVGASEGLLLLDEDKSYYMAKTSPDLASTLEQVIAALNAAVSGLNAAASGLSSLAPVADAILGPLAVIGPVASISSASGSISSAVSILEDLQGDLK